MSRRAGLPAMLMSLILASAIGWGDALAAERRGGPPPGATSAAAVQQRQRREDATRLARPPRQAARAIRPAQVRPAQVRPATLPQVQSKAGLWQLAARKDNAGWVSPAGVEYEAYGYGTDTRVDVVLEHLEDQPEMGIYGVFDGKEHPLALVDEAYAAFRANPTGGNGVQVSGDAKRTLVTVDLGRPVGFVGGEAGKAQGHPTSQRLQLVLDPKAGHKLITAYPAAPPSGYTRAPRREFESSRSDPRFGGPKKITNPLVVSKRATAAHVKAGKYTPRAAVATLSEMVMDLVGRGVPKNDADEVAQHVLLGLPTDAGDTDENNYLGYEPEFVSSYNRARNTSNWVSWVVKPEHIGPDIRSPRFTKARLPFDVAGPEESVGSWLHKGHQRRSGESTASAEMNARTYDGKNITMQAENNNLGPWNGFENYYREYVTSGKHDVYAIGGPVFPKGKPVKTVGKSSDEVSRVAVADETFKIVVVMPKGKRPGQAKPVRVMSIVTPNCQETCPIDGNWADYRVSVKDIEKKTGFRFFDAFPKAQAAEMRNHLDTTYVPLVLGTHAAELYERRGGKLPAAANSNTPAGEQRLHAMGQE